jgi:hypothetical protein
MPATVCMTFASTGSLFENVRVHACSRVVGDENCDARSTHTHTHGHVAQATEFAMWRSR